MDHHEYDQVFYEKGLRYIAGIDEAGRGPIAGPVVAAAVVLKKDNYFEGIDDSKKLSEKKRNSLFWDILCNSVDIGIGIVGNDEIDRINILNATKVAMVHAVNDLRIIPDILLIDALVLPSMPIKQFPIIKGDSKSESIASASIVAKVLRDRLMVHYHEIYPEYHFHAHKGYATKEHIEKIKLYGSCAIHRKSFSPVYHQTLPF